MSAKWQWYVGSAYIFGTTCAREERHSDRKALSARRRRSRIEPHVWKRILPRKNVLAMGAASRTCQVASTSPEVTLVDARAPMFKLLSGCPVIARSWPASNCSLAMVATPARLVHLRIYTGAPRQCRSNAKTNAKVCFSVGVCGWVGRRVGVGGQVVA